MPTRAMQDTAPATVVQIDRSTQHDTPRQAGPREASPTGPCAVNVEIDLEPGITIHKEPDLGMPFVVIESGRVRLNVGIGAGQAGELTSEHLVLVDQLAEGFVWLRDQLRGVAPAAILLQANQPNENDRG